MNKLTLFAPIVIAFLWAGCKTQQPAVTMTTTPSEPMEHRNLDTLVISAPEFSLDEMMPEERTFELPTFNASYTREHDLLHTKLDLRFDWEKEQVIGKATLRLTPYFYPTDSLVLDAKGFEFKQVTLEGSKTPLKYDYDGQQITIRLDKTYTRKDTFSVFFDYVATPAESGGSAAITSDKGLFFINPRGEEGNKPQQIWTQGETENNSRWFPTIDKPNERMTQEITLTVEDKFKTLSNGLLVSSKKNSDGTRTDYWKMDMPHAPYLAMIAVGDFAVVQDKWNNIPVEYYVEPEFKDHARAIFPHTPEMLGFFSDKLNYPYPWQKYSQIIVRDYVSGAMENTTAVIFGEFMQATERELLDNLQNEKIVAHEMFHHWFGDLVTTESWANLTLNEGFANYSEYLWLEHKYGEDEAAYHRLQEMQGYMQSSQSSIHPLIHYGYADKEDMFDAHSYNKGGLILHMLRMNIGDDAFFTALNKYLNEHKYTPVEADELRMAFEDVTGRDLMWFFDQWFHNQGHPSLDINYSYDETAKKAIVTVEQTQDPDQMPPIFQLPVTVDIYTGTGAPIRKNITVNQRKQTFEFDLPAKPKLINFDAENMLLSEKTENLTEEELIFQYNNVPTFLDRGEAVQRLAQSESTNPAIKEVLKKALDDKFYAIRGLAIQYADMEDEAVVKKIAELVTNDPHSLVRSAAIEQLAALEDAAYIDVFVKIIENEKSYSVVASALRALQGLDEDKAMQFAQKLEADPNDAIIVALGQLYAQSDDIAGRRIFFENHWNDVDAFDAVDLFDNYAFLISKADSTAVILDAAEKLKAIAISNGQSLWRKFAATKAINALHGEVFARADAATGTTKAQLGDADTRLLGIITEIKSVEKDPQLTQIYVNFPNPAPKP